MRIVYCLDEMSHPGGIGRVTSLKANWLAEHGYDVWVVTSNQCGKADYYQLNDNVKRKDFSIGFQLGIDNSNLLMKALRKIRKIRQYRKELEVFVNQVKPDIVVSTFINDSDFLYKFRDGSKKVLEFHFSHGGFNSQMRYGPQTLKNKLLLIYRLKKHERIAKKYDAFVVLTHEDARAWIGYDNLHVIPNMLSFETNRQSSCSEKRVIAVGRLDSQKRFDRLINIWYKVHKECPDWKLDIFGSGPEKERLVKQIDYMKLNGTITIKKTTHNIEDEYLNSSVFVMTSVYEGLPMTLLEAFSCGVPCVSYNFKCGPKDIIDSGKNGYCIEEEDQSDYVDKLTKLIKDDRLRKGFGREAKVKSELYTVDSIMPIWVSLFNNLCDKNR